MQRSGWNLDEGVRELLRFRRQRRWAKFHRPKELAAAIAIEAAELQELFLWKGNETAGAVRSNRSRKIRIEEELADISIFILLLAVEMRIDLAGAIRRKNNRNILRYSAKSYRGIAPTPGR